MSYGLAADDVFSVAANATSAEQVAADKQTLKEGGTLYALANCSATGITMQLEVNGFAVYDDLTIDIRNAALVYPDDLIIWHKVKKGDVVSLKFRNATAVALTTNFRLFVA